METVAKKIKASFMINLYDVFCHSTAACILEGAPPVDLPLLVLWCLSVNRTPNRLVSHQVDQQKKVETIIIPSDVQKAGKVSSEIEHQRKWWVHELTFWNQNLESNLKIMLFTFFLLLTSTFSSSSSSSSSSSASSSSSSSSSDIISSSPWAASPVNHETAWGMILSRIVELQCVKVGVRDLSPHIQK